LKILIERGVNVNAEDSYGRRPIRLAVALGLAESVQILLSVDCGLYTPLCDYSLLQDALVLQVPRKECILNMIVVALTDRHTRLLNMARTSLPFFKFSGIPSAKGEKLETYAPDIMSLLLSHGIHLPEALELDGKSFYEQVGYDGCRRLTPKIARTLWIPQY
jgi:hypothetical protein